MAWSPKPMEVSPLVLRRVTVLPRALLQVSPDPCGATTTTNNNKQQQEPSVHQQPPVDIVPRVVR